MKKRSIPQEFIDAMGVENAKAVKNAIRQAITYAESGAIYDIAACAREYSERKKAEQQALNAAEQQEKATVSE